MMDTALWILILLIIGFFFGRTKKIASYERTEKKLLERVNVETKDNLRLLNDKIRLEKANKVLQNANNLLKHAYEGILFGGKQIENNIHVGVKQ